MRKSTNKIKIEKCKCGKMPELLCSNVGEYCIYCPNCHRKSDPNVEIIKSIKSWNESKCKCELTVST